MPLLDFVPSMRFGVVAVAASFMLIEYLIGRLAYHDLHDMRETAATFGVAAGHALIRGGSASHHPLRIVFSEWIAMMREAQAASTFKQKLAVLFGPVTRRKASAAGPQSPESRRAIKAGSES